MADTNPAAKRLDPLNDALTRAEHKLRQLRPTRPAWVPLVLDAEAAAPYRPQTDAGAVLCLGLAKDHQHEKKGWQLMIALAVPHPDTGEMAGTSNPEPIASTPLSHRIAAAHAVRRLHEALVQQQHATLKAVSDAIDELASYLADPKL